MSSQYHWETWDSNVTHTCRLYVHAARRFIVRGDKEICLLSTLAPSVMKMEVAPLSAMAWFVGFVRALKYCGKGLPNRACAVAPTVVGVFKPFFRLDITIVMVSSSTLDNVLTVEGSKEHEVSVNKILHLCTNNKISTPHRKKFQAVGRTYLCIPLVHGSYPAAMNCCAFTWVNPVWSFTFQKRHMREVWPSTTSKPHAKEMFQVL